MRILISREIPSGPLQQAINPIVVSHASTGEVQVVAISGWISSIPVATINWDTWGDGWIYSPSSLWTAFLTVEKGFVPVVNYYRWIVCTL
jgi:hypothetical protein